MGDIVERLQDAIDAVHPNSTDEEWTHLLAESMNAADEINALREALEALANAEYEYRHLHDLHGDSDIRAGRAWDWMRRKGDAARAILAQQGGEDADR